MHVCTTTYTKNNVAKENLYSMHRVHCTCELWMQLQCLKLNSICVLAFVRGRSQVCFKSKNQALTNCGLSFCMKYYLITN